MRVPRLAALLAVVTVFVCLSVTFQGDNVSAVGNPINGSGTNTRIAKFIGSQCVGNSVIRENASGNVGIGTTSPAAKFLVQGGRLAVNGSVAGNTGIFIANQNGPGPIATFSKSNGTDVKVAIGNDGSISVSGQEVIDGSGRLVGEGVQKFNPNQVALLRWYEANESGLTFAAGAGPDAVAFDGANIWVSNINNASISKL